MLTLDQARAVLWPFTRPKRPIGELLDDGTIGAPDLQRAVHVAYSWRVKSALAHGLKPIMCVGETLEQREGRQTSDVLVRQTRGGLDGVAVGADFIIAYEPVWAIGTGRTATPEQAQEVHAMIRERVAARDAAVAKGLRILYGGSVKAQNARELFSRTDIDGGLIGGASLVADDFLAIINAAA